MTDNSASCLAVGNPVGPGDHGMRRGFPPFLRKAVEISVIGRGEGSVSVGKTVGGRCRLRAVGSFDVSNRDILGDAIGKAAESRPRVIEVDLAEVRYIDAGVVRILLRYLASLADQECRLRVLGATGLPAMLLDLSGARAVLCGTPE